MMAVLQFQRPSHRRRTMSVCHTRIVQSGLLMLMDGGMIGRSLPPIFQVEP